MEVPEQNQIWRTRGNMMKSRFSLRRRLILAFLSLSLLVLLASGAGFIYAQSADQAIQATKYGIDQIQRVNELQSDWQNISELVGVLFLTRNVDQTAESIHTRFDIFENELGEWLNQPPGIQAGQITENQTIINDIELKFSALSDTIDEIIRLAAEGQWAVARDMRETVIARQQAELNSGLQRLIANIRAEVQTSFDEAARIQVFSRTVAIASIISSFVIALILGISVTRSIIIPVQQLTEAAHRVTLGDFQPIEPLKRSDEIGNLSRSFALMTDWLRESYENLEQRVFDRTRELEQQNLEIQVAAEIARDISTFRNPQDLLDTAVDLIVRRFGYYHAGIFLLDDLKQYAILRAASGPTSADMLTGMHKLRVGEVGIVGNVAQTGVSRVALDVELDRNYYKNPLLPETRTEIAIPIKISHDVIGVLDVQSNIPGTFNESELHVLEILSDLLAVAIQNADLIQEAEGNLNELENLYSVLSKESWRKIEQSEGFKGYQYDQSGTSPLTIGSYEEMDNGHQPGESIAIPLTIRDQKIGTMTVWPGTGGFLPDDINFLNEVSIRISQAMESARLFNEIQRRAENEKRVRQVSTHMRETLDIESVLRTAVEDIFDAFKLSQISVDLTPTDSLVLDLHGDADGSS
jgi:GAF domain-containing protein/HAMP domain-containing protein